MKIKINQNTYEIVMVDSKDERLDVGEGDYRSGITDFREKKIYIANNLNEDSQRYTIIHELTHAIIDSYGFLQVEWNDEIVADFMANYVYELERILDLIVRGQKKREEWEKIKQNGINKENKSQI